MKTWPHVFEPAFDEDLGLPGSWGDSVVLELGCGKGEYTVALAQRFPEKTFVGVDVKGARMWHGAGVAMEQGLENVRFLRTRVEDLARHFEQGELDEIWITFPDPHPRKSRAKRRLTSPRFLNLYRGLLKEGGLLHLKTDHQGFYEWSMDVLKEEGWELLEHIEGVHEQEGVDALLTEIRTPYERRFLEEGRRIYYLRACPPVL